MTGPRDGQHRSIGRARVHGRARVRSALRLPRRAARADAVRRKAPPPDVSTIMFERPDPTAPIFVDSSGRRRRRLRRLTYLVCALILVLVALYWFSQVFLTRWGIG